MSVENFLYLSMNAFQQACQTFTSQNLGAGEYERIGKVMRVCLSCTVLLGVVQSSAALVLSGQLIALYNEEPGGDRSGVHRLWTVASVYTLWGSPMSSWEGSGDTEVGCPHGHQPAGDLRSASCLDLPSGGRTVDGGLGIQPQFPLSWDVRLDGIDPLLLILQAEDRACSAVRGRSGETAH